MVGDIKDEFDEHTDSKIRRIDERTYVIEGSTPLVDFAKAMGQQADYYDEVREDAETVAGLLLALRGRIPKAGDEVKYQTYTFRILSVKNYRIEKVKLEIG